MERNLLVILKKIKNSACEFKERSDKQIDIMI